MKKTIHLLGFGLLAAATLVHGGSGETAGGSDLLAHYNDGKAADAGALQNLVGASYCSVSGLDAEGFSEGAMITRTQFGKSGPTPAGAERSTGSEWLFARSTSIQDKPETNSDYYGFLVMADRGKTLALKSLEFDFVSVANDEGASDAVYSAQVFAAVDAGDFEPIGHPVESKIDALGWAAVVRAQIDLSSLTGANSVEVRIALGDGGLDSTSGAAFLQDIQLKGTVAR